MTKVKTFLTKLDSSGCDREINEFASTKECAELISVTPTIFEDSYEKYVVYTVLYKANDEVIKESDEDVGFNVIE